MDELENPDPPNDEFPKSEPLKPETPKREPPKFTGERPEENDEKDENRAEAGLSDEKRFEPNPKPAECRPDAVSRLVRKDENSELLRPKVEFLEFPNERHSLSVRTLFAETRDISAPPPWFKLPKECHPPPIAVPEVRADASIDRPDEIPNDCHLPIVLRDSWIAGCEAPK